jgi:hypothetical protein
MDTISDPKAPMIKACVDTEKTIATRTSRIESTVASASLLCLNFQITMIILSATAAMVRMVSNMLIP